ncbi:unnamed protein product, partial [Hapterophycus canaliculatus]
QVELSAQHGSVILKTEDRELVSDGMREPLTTVSGNSWQVNAALRSMVYLSPEDWHGWDQITIRLTDLGDDDISQTINENATSYLHISVAAVNDAPVVEADGLEAV